MAGLHISPTIGVQAVKLCARRSVWDGRLRSGWRVTLYLICYVIGLLVVQLAIVGLYVAYLLTQGVATPSSVMQALQTGQLSIGLSTALKLVELLMAFAVTFLLGRFIDRRAFATFGFRLTQGWLAISCWAWRLPPRRMVLSSSSPGPAAGFRLVCPALLHCSKGSPDASFCASLLRGRPGRGIGSFAATYRPTSRKGRPAGRPHPLLCALWPVPRPQSQRDPAGAAQHRARRGRPGLRVRGYQKPLAAHCLPPGLEFRSGADSRPAGQRHALWRPADRNRSRRQANHLVGAFGPEGIWAPGPADHTTDFWWWGRERAR